MHANPRSVLPILVPAASLGLLASSIYVPSLPDIARELAVPVGLGRIDIQRIQIMALAR